MNIKDKFKNISATVEAFSCNVLHDLEDINDIKNYIESLKCCGNCGIDKDYSQDSKCFHCHRGDCLGLELDNWQPIN